MRFFKVISSVKKNKSPKTIPVEHKNKKRSLQAQARLFIIQKRKEAHSLISSAIGSITVEASLTIPVFLCMICSLLSMAQFLLIEAEVQYATAQTAREIAVSQSVTTMAKGTAGMNSAVKAITGTMNAYTFFYDLYHAEGLSTHLITGGKYGITVTADTSKTGEGIVTVNTFYRLRLPYVHYLNLQVEKQSSVTTRLFTGYAEHSGMEDEDDPIVYVTAFGGVYHTSLSCSHITRKVSGNQIGSLKNSKYTPCSRCMKNADASSGVYVTAYGNHYHSSLNCSELKRTVRAVRKSELGNMKMCSKCASGGH